MKTVSEEFIAWMIANDLKTSNGQPFEWYEHQFMLQPLADMHPYQGWNKSAQVGASEMMICKSIYLAAKCGLNIGYTIHNSKAMDDFAKTKFDPIVAANQPLSSIIDGNTSKKVVEFEKNERFIHLVGAYNSAASAQQEQTTVGISFTADILIHDEASRSDQYVLNQLKSRILNSKYGYIWKFDNPKYPGFGADKIWQESDQMHYMVRCPHCRKQQYLDWFRLDEHTYENGTMHTYVDPINKLLVCANTRCGKFIDDTTRRTGVWIPKWRHKAGRNKDGSYFGYRGYWINQLMYIKHSISSLLLLQDGPDPMTKSVFYNMVLGKPYIGSDIRVTRENIVKCVQARPSTYGAVAMGVDQGREKQYVLGDEHGIFKVGRCTTWAEIRKIRDQYDATIVMDANPETGEPKRICEDYKGKAWRCIYKPESDQSEIAKFSPQSDRSLVLVRREEAFDVLADMFAQGQIKLSAHVNSLHEYIDDWSHLIRMTVPDKMGNERFVWDQSSGPTDFAHATLYWYVAMMRCKKIGVSKMGYKKNTTTKPVFGKLPE